MWRRRLLVLLGVAGLLSGAVPAIADPVGRPDAVRTAEGPVRGVVERDARVFRGIPFAAPPVGELRWRPPQPVRPWREPLDATEPGAACAQPSDFGLPESFVEDCLYLNVTTPRRGGRNLPVMVWLHGGSFTTGEGAIYDARALAARGDVVVVTPNYRLGPFGFLAMPSLTAESPGSQSGNYGIQDQQAALRWVQRNAAAFGGDPRNVTIFGGSAGGASVCVNLTSPTAAGLFHRAIAQSFSCASELASKQQAEAAGVRLATGFGCPDPATAAACMRTKPVRELTLSWPGGFPVVGGPELPLHPPEALRRDRFSHVPLIMGNTRDEMRLYVGLEFEARGNPVTPQLFEQRVRETFGGAADRVLARYPLSAYPTPAIALSTVVTDAGNTLATCDHLAGYRLASARPRPVPVYAYQFADRTAPVPVEIPGLDEGAMHATELPYLFTGVFGEPLTGPQRDLSNRMIDYWTAFARTGDPNRAGLPAWPEHRPGAGANVLTLDLATSGGTRLTDVARASNCAFWNSIGFGDGPREPR
ncbi:carboxylesterase family protein [Actinosynnema pretiosum subsp. pretiosum]|uniref:Carboxylic ester hydrolase n=1 Tax=Actinosynnema pretiosum subsp. pretiosum TaxID=103721 RepID=A0AA45R3R9_9PSEU|nr:Carboxylesterase, type B [Actinosynnema pretiosum subsp. pretiosum]QUF04039.1 carboxylesterase family protein [Actinosynnema pretiosum subsp. pretiosum]